MKTINYLIDYPVWKYFFYRSKYFCDEKIDSVIKINIEINAINVNICLIEISIRLIKISTPLIAINVRLEEIRKISNVFRKNNFFINDEKICFTEHFYRSANFNSCRFGARKMVLIKNGRFPKWISQLISERTMPTARHGGARKMDQWDQLSVPRVRPFVKHFPREIRHFRNSRFEFAVEESNGVSRDCPTDGLPSPAGAGPTWAGRNETLNEFPARGASRDASCRRIEPSRRCGDPRYARYAASRVHTLRWLATPVISRLDVRIVHRLSTHWKNPLKNIYLKKNCVMI